MLLLFFKQSSTLVNYDYHILVLLLIAMDSIFMNQCAALKMPSKTPNIIPIDTAMFLSRRDLDDLQLVSSQFKNVAKNLPHKRKLEFSYKRDMYGSVTYCFKSTENSIRKEFHNSLNGLKDILGDYIIPLFEIDPWEWNEEFYKLRKIASAVGGKLNVQILFINTKIENLSESIIGQLKSTLSL